jgi:hypothetical protein
VSSLQVDRLSIRVPGVGRELGKSLGRQVAERLAPSLELAPREASFERVHVELTAERGESADALAGRIAAEVASAIGAATTLEAGR